jgi:hypothetical protein
MFKAGRSDTSFSEPSELVHQGPLPARTLTWVFGSSVTTGFLKATLCKRAQRIYRLYLVGYHVKTPSILSPIRVDFDGQGLGSGLGALGPDGSPDGSICLININGSTNVGEFGNMPSKQLIAEWKNYDGSLYDLNIKTVDAYSPSTAVTHAGLTLVFEAESLNWH